MALFAVLSVFLVAHGAPPRDDAESAVVLPTSRTWAMFHEACVDTFPSYARIENVLDRMEFERARHFASVRRGFERWRGETANVIFSGLNGSGPLSCMMTVWKEPSPSNKRLRQCPGGEDSHDPMTELSAVKSWETPKWLVVILNQTVSSPCESYILIATSKTP